MSIAYKPYQRATDLGTPGPAASTKLITLTIDGEEVTVPEGTTVLRAAALNGVNIPKLCATDSLEPFGSCRLCLVEIEGMKGLPASCTTEAKHGHEGHDAERARSRRRAATSWSCTSPITRSIA